MNKISIIIIMAVLLLPIIGFSCTRVGPPPASHSGPAEDYVGLIDELRANGAKVEPAGDISQPFFSVRGSALSVNGENVQVFEFEDDAAAKTEAETISPDGSSIGTSIVSWVATPHFYQKGRIIVLYVGTIQSVLNALEEILGTQIAGGATVTLPPPVPAPAPTVPSNGTPLAPTTEETLATPLQIEVFIDGLAFNPVVLNIPVGTIVVWYHNDLVTHTVTARDNSFDSGNLSPGDPGETFQYTFEQSGELEYYCRIHPSMVGTIAIE